MTIHGAKGLEFPVVHLSGVNKDTIPGSYRGVKCPPPEGMVAGGNGSSEDIAKEAHENEQECLFMWQCPVQRIDCFTVQRLKVRTNPCVDFPISWTE